MPFYFSLSHFAKPLSSCGVHSCVPQLGALLPRWLLIITQSQGSSLYLSLWCWKVGLKRKARSCLPRLCEQRAPVFALLGVPAVPWQGGRGCRVAGVGGMHCRWMAVSHTRSVTCQRCSLSAGDTDWRAGRTHKACLHTAGHNMYSQPSSDLGLQYGQSAVLIQGVNALKCP